MNKKNKYKSKNNSIEFSTKSPKKKELTSEIDLPINDLDMVVYNNQYFNTDKTLRYKGGSDGIRMYDEILKDPHSHSVLNTRFQAVVGKEWSITPSSDSVYDKMISEFVNDVLYNCNFDFIRYHLLKSILYGFSVAEIIWKIDNGKIVIDKFIDKSSHKFVFDENRNMKLLTQKEMIYGVNIPDKKFLKMQFGSIDNPYGQGLAQSLWYYVWFKKSILKYWLIFAEKFGQPSLLGKYPAGMEEGDRNTLQEILNSVQKNTSIVIPEEVSIELLEASRPGNATYNDFCNFLNKEISKEVLGQILTTESSENGSYALGKIQNQVRQDIMESDADLLDETLNESIIKWIVDLNFNVVEYPKIITNTTPPIDLLAKSQIDKNLSDIGVRLSNDYFKKTYSLEDSDIIEQEKEVENTSNNILD